MALPASPAKPDSARPRTGRKGNLTGRGRPPGLPSPLPAIPVRCLTPIEGKFSNDAELSARNVAHRPPEIFSEIVAKSSLLLRKTLSAHGGYAPTVSSVMSPTPVSALRGGGSASKSRRSVSTQFTRGYALHRLQQFEQAAEDFSACSRSDPEHAAPALYNRGCALYALGRHADAVRDFTKALKLDARNPLFIESRARVLKEMGKFEEAIHDYTWLDSLRHAPTPIAAATVATSELASPSAMLEASGSPVQSAIPSGTALQSSNSAAASLASAALESTNKAWLERFLQQEPGKSRSSADVAEAARLARSWSFFRGMRVQMVERCLREASYWRFESDQVVVEQGQHSPSYYVVLDAVAPLVKAVSFQGSSSRELRTLYQGDTIGLEPFSATNTDGKLGTLRHRARRQSLLRSRTGSVANSPQMLRMASSQSVAGLLASGPSVSNRGGSSLSAREVATYSCLGEVNCLLLDVDVYIKVLREHEERVLEDRLEFLRRCRAFESCSEEMLSALAAVSGAKLVDPGVDALRAGDVVKQLFMIKKGVCQVRKIIAMPPPASVASTRPGSRHSNGEGSTDGSWVLDNGWMLTNPRLVTNAQAMAASELQHAEEVTVAVLASGQLFGELSVLQPGQRSQVAVRTQTLAELLVFQDEDLIQLRVQYLSGTMNALQESLLFHNPPQQKVAQLRHELTSWSREKRGVLEELFPPGSPAAPKSPRRRGVVCKSPGRNSPLPKSSAKRKMLLASKRSAQPPGLPRSGQLSPMPERAVAATARAVVEAIEEQVEEESARTGATME